jgi:hypothetical protein
MLWRFNVVGLVVGLAGLLYVLSVVPSASVRLRAQENLARSLNAMNRLPERDKENVLQFYNTHSVATFHVYLSVAGPALSVVICLANVIGLRERRRVRSDKCGEDQSEGQTSPLPPL